MKNLYSALFSVLFFCTVAKANDTIYLQRKEAYIDNMLAAPGGEKLCLQAYRNLPLDTNELNDKLYEVQTNSTADFTIIEMVRLLYLTNGEYDSRIVPVLDGVKYWVNYGDTVHNYWSENHMIMWMSSDWLLHEKYGRAIDVNLHNRLVHYLNLKIQYGYYEFFSSVYAPYAFSGLVNLADFAQDPEIKDLATQAAQKLLVELMWQTNNLGVFFPAAGRNYPSKYDNPYGQNHNNLIYLITGMGQPPVKASASGAFLATSSLQVNSVSASWQPVVNTTYHIGHTLQDGFTINANQQHTDRIVFQWSSGAYFHPDVVQETAQLLVDSNLWDQVDFSLLQQVSNFPPSSFPVLSNSLSCISKSSVISGQAVTLFKHYGIALASVSDFWKGKVGFQVYPCVANVGTTAVYTASGAVMPDWDQRDENTQNIHLPYVEQHGNIALLMYRPEYTPTAFLGPQFADKTVALRWNNAAFDEVLEDSLWLLGRQADRYVAVRRPCTNLVQGIPACPTPENGGQSWVIMVGDSGLYGSFNAFKTSVHNAQFSEEWYYNPADTEMVYHASIIVDTTQIDYAWGRDSLLPAGINTIAVNAFSIYPNPAVDNISIKPANNISYSLSLLNIEGRLLLQTTKLQGNYTLPVNGLAEGLYILKLTDEKGRQSLRKIIVQRQ